MFLKPLSDVLHIYITVLSVEIPSYTLSMIRNLKLLTKLADRNHCRFSEKMVLSDDVCPMFLPDQTPCFKKYTSSDQFKKNVIAPPNKVVSFYVGCEIIN